MKEIFTLGALAAGIYAATRRPAAPDAYYLAPTQLYDPRGRLILKRTLSANGLNHLKQREGLRFSPYRDSVGKWTIGYGHLIRADETHLMPPASFKGRTYPAIKISHAEAERLLREDTQWAVEVVNRSVRVPLTQNEFDALVSFVFNIGSGNFAKSRTLALINQGRKAEGGRAMMGWLKQPELRSRRQSEVALFLTSSPELRA